MERIKNYVSSFVMKFVVVKRQADTPRYYCDVLISTICFRFILMTYPVLSNHELNSHDVTLLDLLTKGVDYFLCLVCFLLCMSCIVSTVNMLSLFDLQSHTQQSILKEHLRPHCGSARVMIVTILFVSIAGWFIFVQRIWSGHLSYIIQTLDLFTSFIMVLTIFSGLLISIIPAFMGYHKQSLQTATSKYTQYLAWHKWSNAILIAYTALIVSAACVEGNSSCMFGVFAYLLVKVFVCLLVEVYCREYIVRGSYDDSEGGQRHDIPQPPELYMLHVVHGTDIPGTDVAVFSNPYPALSHMYRLGDVELDHNIIIF